jgi:hypothetical protein
MIGEVTKGQIAEVVGVAVKRRAYATKSGMASVGSKHLIGSLRLEFRGVTGLHTYLQQRNDPNLR